MKELPHTQKTAPRKVERPRKLNYNGTTPRHGNRTKTRDPGPPIKEFVLKVICLYPSVIAGKLARQWLESALRTTAPQSSPSVEYFNYAVLSHDGVSWAHVIGRMRPDIILMVGDGNLTLGSGLRHSLRELFSKSMCVDMPIVIFRDLEPEPTLNTRVLLDYVSALTQQNHCELSAMNGNGTTISCYRHPIHLLKTRTHYE